MTEHSTRPPLTPSTNLDDFRSFYWLKEELAIFCRANALSAAGSKMEIAARIEQFLFTGEAATPAAATRSRRHSPDETLSLSTIITTNYTNSERNRAFFKSVIGPRFHFNTAFMKFMKASVGKTYQDAVTEWLRLEQEAKNGVGNANPIDSQFEYNRHVRDYFEKNPGKTLQDAIAAWNELKRQRKNPDRFTPD